MTLNGTTAAPFTTAALLVTKVYYGDVASASTWTVQVGVAEDGARKVGRALTTVTAPAAAVDLLLTP
jgi:hypothetical protein